MFVLAGETLLHNLNQRIHVGTPANVSEIKHLGMRYNFRSAVNDSGFRQKEEGTFGKKQQVRQGGEESRNVIKF